MHTSQKLRLEAGKLVHEHGAIFGVGIIIESPACLFAWFQYIVFDNGRMISPELGEEIAAEESPCRMVKEVPALPAVG